MSYAHSIEESVYFSLCLDESTDITDTNQLIIFIRTITSDFITNEELLALHPMHETTKGSDIYKGVIEEVKKYTTFKKCSCIVTDGAPAMIGIDNGFVGLQKKNNKKEYKLCYFTLYYSSSSTVYKTITIIICDEFSS